MSATLLDGTALSRTVRTEVKDRVATLVAAGHRAPKLVAVLAGDDPASETYVGMKQRACAWVGIESETLRMSGATTQDEADAVIRRLNADASVDGVLVQHPLPKHIDEAAVLRLLDPAKDVDGVTPASMGALLAGDDRAFAACTPLGIMELLSRYDIPIEGRRAVVIGRSVILGKPLALLLLARNATVTICHSRTRDLADRTREADLLFAAIGKPEMIKASMVKPGAVVVDAGYNRVEGRKADVGDVDFEPTSEVASHITPVPGGVGPMTIAMLLRNTTEAAERRVATGQ